MDFQQIRDFVNPAVAQATGLQEVENLSMPVPVAYVPVQLVIDGALSLTSENPVQNKVIAVAIQQLDGRITAIEGQFSEGVTAAVNNWLAAHPEATTTVQDGAISYAKLDANLKGKADEVSELKSAIDDANVGVESFPAYLFVRGQINADGTEGTYYQNRIKFANIQNTGNSPKCLTPKEEYGAWFSIYDENGVFQWRSNGYIDHFVLPANTNFKVEIARRGQTDADHATPADIQLVSEQLVYNTAVQDMIADAYKGKINYTLLDIDMEMGTLNANGENQEDTYNKTRKMRSVDKIYMPSGTVISCIDSTLVYMVYIFDLDKNFVSSTSWLDTAYTVDADSYIRIQFKLQNDSVISEYYKPKYRYDVKIENSLMTILENSELEVASIKKFIDNTDEGRTITRDFNSFSHEYGTMNAKGENDENAYNKTRKIRSVEWIYLNKGDVFGTRSSLLRCYAASTIEKLMNADRDVNSGWITSDYTVPFSGLYRLQFSLRTDAQIPEEMVEQYSSYIVIKSNILSGDYENVKQLFDLMTTGRKYVYSGVMLNFNKTTYNMVKLTNLPALPSGVSAREASAIYNGILFKFYANDVVQLIDYNSSEVLATINAGTEHANSASFSNEFYNTDDEFPLCYVGSNNSANDIYVVRITRNEATIIRTIRIPVAVGGYYASNCCVDINNNMLWTTGYVNNDYLNPDNGNGVYLCSWNLAGLTADGDNTYTPELINKTLLPFISTMQDMDIHAGDLYVLSSSPYASSSNPTKLYVISLNGKRINNILTEFYENVHDHECEGLVIFERGNKYIMEIDTIAGVRMELLF